MHQIHFLIAPYITGKPATPVTPYDNFKVFHCPSDNITPMMEGDGNFNTGSSEDDPARHRWELCCYPKFGSSYQWRLGGNTLPGSNEQQTFPLSGVSMSSVPSPSHLGAARDAQTWHLYSRTHTRADWDDPHAGGNVLYLDGHVKFGRGGEFLSGIF